MSQEQIALDIPTNVSLYMLFMATKKPARSHPRKWYALLDSVEFSHYDLLHRILTPYNAKLHAGVQHFITVQ